MPVDWDLVQSALQHSRDGNQLKALAAFEKALSDAESERDKAAILLGKASCYSNLGDTSKALELLRCAKGLLSDDRAMLAQVAVSEASVYAQRREYDRACELFATAKSEFHDVLSEPSMADSLMDLDSRLACALVDAERYKDAVELFEALVTHPDLEDRQRIELFYGFALFRTGRFKEAQSLLFKAASGANPDMAKTALGYLSEMGSEAQQ